jgi:hypothetical protein
MSAPDPQAFFEQVQRYLQAILKGDLPPQPDPQLQQQVIDEVGEALDRLERVIRKLDVAVTLDSLPGAGKGGRELKVLAQQASDVAVQTAALKARLKLQKTGATAA